MAVINSETLHTASYLGESAPHNIINEEIIVQSGAGILKPGTVLGYVTKGALSVVTTARAGNTGNGSIGSPTADAGVAPGAYTVTIIEPAANAGTFVVERPDGTEEGTGTVGVAYNGAVNFTLADGATDFVAGDAFVIQVTAAAVNKYVLHDAALTNGAEAAAAILYNKVDATSADVKAVATVRGPATIFEPYLTFKAGISAANKAAALAALRAKGMAVIPQHAV